MMNIILGGTHGLGSEIAKQLKEDGESVSVVGRTFDSEKHGQGISGDLSKPEDVARIMAALSEIDADAFYWVAGVGYKGDFANQTQPEVMAQINFANALPIVQQMWKYFLAKGSATKMVVVSSSSGVKARPNEAVYAATKHAQVGFARSLGLESERLSSRVKISLFLPGGMQTPFWDNNRPNSYEEFLDPKKVAREIINDVRMQGDYYYERAIERGSL